MALFGDLTLLAATDPMASRSEMDRNLLLNPEFSGAKGGFWTTTYNGTQPPAARVNLFYECAERHGGRVCRVVPDAAAPENPIQWRAGLAAGAEHTVSAWVKPVALGASLAEPRVRVLDAAAVVLSQTVTAPLVGQWQRVSATFTVSGDAARVCGVELFTPDDAEVWWDAVQLERRGSVGVFTTEWKQNLLANPSFEAPLLGTPPAPAPFAWTWTTDGADSPQIFLDGHPAEPNVPTVAPYFAAMEFLATSAATAEGVLSQQVAVTPAKAHTLSCYVLVPSTSTLVPTLRDGVTGTALTPATTIKGAGWTRLELTVVPETPMIDFQLVIPPHVGGLPGTFAVTMCQLEAGASSTPYQNLLKGYAFP